MHTIRKQYTIGTWPFAEATVECSCGWKEKARTMTEAETRFKAHQNYPHRP